jgi:tetratricopeptide (TPR) repeat protein
MPYERLNRQNRPMKPAARTLIFLILAAVVAAVFSVGITDGHIGHDDWGYTGGCAFVRDGLCWKNIARAFTDFGYGAIWMPLTFVSYMTDISLFGGSWKVYHAVNVFYHLVNAGLVLSLLRACLCRLHPDSVRAAAWLPPLLAALWALHPLRAEAVTCVASRKEELWTLFTLLGLRLYVPFLDKATFPRYLGIGACFVAACLSKPTAMCFPFLALSLALMLGRLTRRHVLSMLPFILLAAGVGLVTLYSQSHPTNAAGADLFRETTAWRALNAAVSLGLYVWYTFCPTGIHMDYRAVFNGWPVNGSLGLATLAVTALLFALACRTASAAGRRVLAGALLMGLFALGPTLGVFGYVNGDQAMADRYTYLPHVAFVLLLGSGLCRLIGRGVPARPVWAALAALALAETVALVPVVRSYETAYSASVRTLQKDADNWRALRIVGNEYCARQNRTDEGIALLRRSLRLRPSQVTADALAYILALRGRPGDFDDVRRLGRAVAAQPEKDDGGMMLDALGIVCMRTGDFRRAADCFARSLKAPKRNHSPDYTMLHLALNLANTGRRAEARRLLLDLRRSRVKHIVKRAEASLRRIAREKENVRFDWE